jgi:uncharacterized membrane protein
LNHPTTGILCGELIFAPARQPWIPGEVFWPYLAGIAILTIGILTSGKEVLRTRGIDRILVFGPLFFAPPMAVFAAQHFTEARAVATLVPSWMPGHLFWTYFVGTALIAASTSIALNKQAQWAAILLAVMLIVFVLLLHVPRIMADPKNAIPWAIALRDVAFSAGAMAIAGAQTREFGYLGRNQARNWLRTLARVSLSVSSIFYGVEHFLHPEFMPAVDFDRSMPTWIPIRMFWSYLAGTAFLIAGMSLLGNRKTRPAATLLGVVVLILVLFVYLPILVSNPFDIDNGLNFLVSTLAFSGVALLVAKAMPGDGRGNKFKDSRELPRAGTP